MDRNNKRLVLSQFMDHFRAWSYESLAAEVDRTRNAHDCLGSREGAFDDGTKYFMEVNVFWDDRAGGDIRVVGELYTDTHGRLFGVLPAFTPDVVDSFIVSQQGNG